MKKYCEGKRHLKANTPKTKKTFQKQKNIPKTKKHSKNKKPFQKTKNISFQKKTKHNFFFSKF